MLETTLIDYDTYCRRSIKLYNTTNATSMEQEVAC